jgi:Sortase domain
MTVPRMPQSVLRRRPAQVVAVQRVQAPLRPLPTPPPALPGPRPRGLPAPPPVRGRRPLPVGLIAAALVFLGLFTTSAGVGAATGFDISDLFRGPGQAPPRAFPVLEPSRPVQLTIPAIRVRAPVLQVGLAADGSVDVPPLQRHNEAGWFDEGPTPGQFGPALIVGHADTRTGPSVFHDLSRLKPGQKIEVLRRDNRVAVFEVNSVEHFGKTRLPVERVYGDYSRPLLRLMTCGGTWLGGRLGYEDNIVVFASLVSSRQT